LLPIRWGKGNGNGEEQIGEANVRLNALMMGGNLVAVDPGFTKCAAIRFLPVLARTEKSCSLFKGSRPAPSIYFFRTIGCFLYLRVGDYKFYPLCSAYYEILNVLLNLSTIEWLSTLFYISGCLSLGAGSLPTESFSELSAGGSLPDSLSVGNFLGNCYF
jgi:hypothetical protein